MSKIRFLLLAAVTAVIANGCNSSGCTDNQSSIPYAGFYSSEGAAISIDSLDISGVGAPGDSILYPSGQSLSKVYLPFRAQHSSTAYCFHYTQKDLSDPAYNDTITFEYTSRPFFASEECGAMLEYVIGKVRFTRHVIEKVEVTDSIVTNTDLERIKIYFRTSTDSETEQ